ncbi:uncharacterized protein LOC132633553 [Lycium barbarum]|uniref:uncharacterized protein LOC132633553 n=1 Tax=Lycium barbarum TaxID=112863 RepID=UPI00293E5C91|nr:uncharacterized protein LOC132633553 [Lycium barbarum]
MLYQYSSITLNSPSEPSVSFNIGKCYYCSLLQPKKKQNPSFYQYLFIFARACKNSSKNLIAFMDLASANYCEAPPLFPSQGEATLEGKNGNPFLDSFPDPLCKLNLKETSDFVKSLPTASINGGESRVFLRKEGVSSVTRRNNMDAPSTPGRPIFSFSIGGNFSRKHFPSKWDDAEKWLVNGSSFQDSPASHHNNNCFKPPLETSKLLKQYNGFKLKEAENVFAEKNRVTDEKVSKVASDFQVALPLNHHHISAGASYAVSPATDVFLKDKFTDEVESPKFRCIEPTKEGFLFGNGAGKSMKDATTEVIHEVKHRDIGTEMTPIGSSTTSRCHTPFKSPSPARHNTPADRSGPLALPSSGSDNTIDIMQLQECHLAKLQFGTEFDSVTTNWSSREEEEEDISKSLRHFEINNECRKSVSESKTRSWEEEEKNKCCLRYQREEAKIQAWINLQNAKAEAQSKKLEVKIQKMRSNLEEKLMKRTAIVHRKAEEWRTTAQLQHKEQIEKVVDQGRKMMLTRQNSHLSAQTSCGCLPCRNHHI